MPWLRISKKKTEKNPLACIGTALAKDPTPMDLVTSRMLSWMATNCEEPRLIDLVIQSLAGAKPWLPRLPLLQCGLQMQLLDRLYGLIDFDFTKHTYFLKGSASPDLTLLYFRALFFLHSYNNGEGFYNDPKIASCSFALQNTWGKDFDIRRSGLIVDTLFSSWGYDAKFDLPRDAADPAAYMNVFKLPSCRVDEGSLCAKFDVYECFQSAHDFIEQHTAKKVVYHPATLLMLVQNMTNQFALPSRSWSEFKTLGVHFPVILVKLLEFLQSTSGDEELYHAIGVGLTICAFTFGKYPATDNAHAKNPGGRVLDVLAYHNSPKHLVHFQTQTRLSLRDSRIMETRSMLNFGLLALLEQPVSPLIGTATIQNLAKAFHTVDQREHFSYQYIHTLARDFTFERHVNLALGQFLQRSSNTPYPYTASTEAAWFSFVSAVLHRITCTPVSLRDAQELDSIYRLLVRTLCDSPSSSPKNFL
ncbi:hypothetical protein FRC11_014345 [Ceratobasidium sp. 423]|nr:hypothetical protein FRC11_014345 [Ceratobasidium sp. 423]